VEPKRVREHWQSAAAFLNDCVSVITRVPGAVTCPFAEGEALDGEPRSSASRVLEAAPAR
jgi:hypothetical protein